LRYDPVPSDEMIPDLGSGWITYGWWLNNSGSPISQLSTQWTVPPEPQNNAGKQTIFLFNGIENASKNEIVQPVLQWGVSAAGGGNHWAVTNWHVDSSGHVSCPNRPLQRVFPGDTLTGIVSLVSQNAGSFSYRSSFAEYPDLDLDVGAIDELVWVSATLEAYQVSQRTDFPNTPTTSMSSIAIAAGGLAPLVGWRIENQVPDYGQSSGLANAGNPGGQIDIDYGP